MLKLRWILKCIRLIRARGDNRRVWWSIDRCQNLPNAGLLRLFAVIWKCNLVTSEGQVLIWANDIRYLGIYIVSASNFKCSLDNAKRSFYLSFNAILGKVGRIASNEVIVQLTRSSADADNRLDAFSSQSRSTNIVPFHMLGIVSHCAIVTCL